MTVAVDPKGIVRYVVHKSAADKRDQDQNSQAVRDVAAVKQ
jgi:hypothetical protein